MKRIFVLACLCLALTSCKSEVRRSQACYQTTPYDYSNLPTVQKGEQAPFVASYGNCPADVVDVLARDTRCTEWYAEEKFQRDHPKPGSETKRVAAMKMMQHYRCDSVPDDILRLQLQYQHDPAVQRALGNASIDTVI